MSWGIEELIAGPFGSITEANAWAAANTGALFVGLLCTISGVQYTWQGAGWVQTQIRKISTYAATRGFKKLSVMASPPTVSVTTPSPWYNPVPISGGIGWFADPTISVGDGSGIWLKAYDWGSGIPAGAPNLWINTNTTPFRYENYLGAHMVVPPNNTGAQQISTISLIHYGTSISFCVSGYPFSQILVRVDGEYASLTPSAMSNNYNPTWLNLVFGSAGARKIEIEGQISLLAVVIGATDSAMPSDYNGPSLYILGDSYFDGALGVVTQQTMVHRMKRYLGINHVTTDAIGGTGLVKSNGASANYMTRVQSILPQQKAIKYASFLVSGSINDSAYDAPTITSAALAFIDYCRSHSPNCEIIVPCFASACPTPSAQTVVLSGWKAAAAQRPLVYPIDLQGVLSGSGYSTGLAGKGNSDIIRGSDGTHYTDAGHEIFSRILADVVMRI